ncbi:auxin response factor [Artemisia annua]|uniref:Auxin response factor n=1 Tax=Artemisia annua TaxID=35608 RepID=A0A2U1MBU7_ARTAN|nr:auxin response factor [Artemisia annua]
MSVSSGCIFYTKWFNLKIGEMILRNDKGRSWKIQLRKNGERIFYLGCGLKDFCNANGLKVGDAYKFELIENENNKPPVENFSLNVDCTMDAEEPIKVSDSIHKLTSFDALDVEEPLTEMTKKLKKRKRQDYASQSKHEFQFQLGKDRSFVAVMTPSCIRSSTFCVPLKFARSNGLITKRLYTQIVNMPIVIIDEAQRTWPATLKIWRTGTKVCITCWRKLQVKHKLKVGDACTFELVKLGEVPVFNFYRKKPFKNNNQAEVEIDSAIKKETSSTLKSHPYFISTLNLKRITKTGLYLPVEFSISNGLKLEEIILRYDNRRSSKVQLAKHGEKTFKLARGFKDFCVKNGLQEGNVYKYEIVEDWKDNPPVMNVSLYEELAHGKKNYPYFDVYLPKEFARKNGLFNKEEMILKNVRNEGSWTVELKSSKNNRYCYIRRGWKEFYVANGLKDGDHFKFELVNNGEKPTANFRFQNIS